MRHLPLLLILGLATTSLFAQGNVGRTDAFLKAIIHAGEPISTCADEVNVEAASYPIPIDFKGVELSSRSVRQTKFEGVNVSVMTKEQAQRLFDEFQSIDYIPNKYIEDGCYARAHELALIAERHGIELGKAFMVPPGNGDRLLYPKNLKDQSPPRFASSFSGWKYHAVSFVMVDNGGKLEPYVFDLGVSEKIQNFSEWKNNLSSGPKKSKVIVREKSYVFQDGQYQSPGVSIIDRTRETQELIDQLGMSEYLFQLEQGWL